MYSGVITARVTSRLRSLLSIRHWKRHGQYRSGEGRDHVTGPSPGGRVCDSNLAVRFRRQRNRAAWRRLVEPREVGRLVVANRGVADRTLSCRKERRRSSAHRIQTSAAVERAAQGSGVRSRERGGNLRRGRRPGRQSSSRRRARDRRVVAQIRPGCRDGADRHSPESRPKHRLRRSSRPWVRPHQHNRANNRGSRIRRRPGASCTSRGCQAGA